MRAIAWLARMCAIALRRSTTPSAEPRHPLRLAIMSAGCAWLVSRGVVHLSPVPAIALAAVAFLLAPRIARIRERRREDARFADALPDAIDMVVRMLRAGLSVYETIHAVGREAEPPVGAAFAAIADQIDIGISLDEALVKTSDRVGNPDFRFFAVAVALQQSTGGNLAATLETLSDLIRKRRAVRLKARATTVEVRASAFVLGAIPFVVAAALLVVAPTYLLALVTDPRGEIILSLALLCLAAAWLTMRAMIDNALAPILPVRRHRARGYDVFAPDMSKTGATRRFAAVELAGRPLELARRLAPLGIPTHLAPQLLVALELLAGGGLAGLLVPLTRFAGHTTADVVMIGLFGMALGWFIPPMILDRLGRERRRWIVQGLPQAIELLVIAVEAGLSLEDAINHIAVELWAAQPAIAVELARTGADLRVLPDPDDAFRRLCARVNQPALHSAVTTLAQTLKYGTPLVQALRAVASELHNNTLLKVEENANRLPVLLTIPMIIFIIPSIMMIIGGPAFLKILDGFLR